MAGRPGNRRAIRYAALNADRRTPNVSGGGDTGQRWEKNIPGIIVGIGGSAHSRDALDWAVHGAGAWHAPLTVLTVNQSVAAYAGDPRTEHQEAQP